MEIDLQLTMHFITSRKKSSLVRKLIFAINYPLVTQYLAIEVIKALF